MLNKIKIMIKLSLTGDWQKFSEIIPLTNSLIFFWIKGIFGDGYVKLINNNCLIYLRGGSIFGSLEPTELQGVKQIPEDSYWILVSQTKYEIQ